MRIPELLYRSCSTEGMLMSSLLPLPHRMSCGSHLNRLVQAFRCPPVPVHCTYVHVGHTISSERAEEVVSALSANMPVV